MKEENSIKKYIQEGLTKEFIGKEILDSPLFPNANNYCKLKKI